MKDVTEIKNVEEYIMNIFNSTALQEFEKESQPEIV